MKVVIAVDSFKESLSSKEVCEVIERGFKAAIKNVSTEVIPIGDGGEGTVEALVDATNGKLVNMTVKGPLLDSVEAYYGISGDGKTAFIEMAKASGLGLVPLENRNPMITSTFGTGELIKDALDKGIQNIIIGIGGSATNDGGIGMASALGAKFLDSQGHEVEPNNQSIEKLEKIDLSNLHPAIKNVKFTVACDVDNPLTGTNGASAVYGPQKGADEKMVQVLDQNLKKLSDIIKSDLNKDVNEIKGAGAAGGLGAGLVAFVNGELKSGIDIVLDYLNFDERVKDASLVITGEGRFDFQTVKNKAPIGVAKRAKKYDIPVIGISAVFGKEYTLVLEHGIDAVFNILDKLQELNEAYKNTETNLYNTAYSVAKLYNIK